MFPDTLDAYIHEYGKLVPYLAPDINDKPPSDAAPIDLTSKVISLQVSRVFAPRGNVPDTPVDRDYQLPVIQDTAPLGKNFGDVLIDVAVESPYQVGDTVVAQFVGCALEHPRLYLRVDDLSDPLAVA